MLHEFLAGRGLHDRREIGLSAGQSLIICVRGGLEHPPADPVPGQVTKERLRVERLRGREHPRLGAVGHQAPGCLDRDDRGLAVAVDALDLAPDGAGLVDGAAGGMFIAEAEVGCRGI